MTYVRAIVLTSLWLVLTFASLAGVGGGAGIGLFLLFTGTILFVIDSS